MVQPEPENVPPLFHVKQWPCFLPPRVDNRNKFNTGFLFFPYLCWCPDTPAKAAFGPVCWGTRWCRTPRTHRQLPGWSGSQTPSGWKQSHCEEWLHPGSEWPNWRLAGVQRKREKRLISDTGKLILLRQKVRSGGEVQLQERELEKNKYCHNKVDFSSHNLDTTK